MADLEPRALLAMAEASSLKGSELANARAFFSPEVL